jgi:hypothetical protein
MWEKLFELALFVRSSGTHRKPTEILKTFLKTSSNQENRLSKDERKKLNDVFAFLHSAYNHSELGKTRLASDHTHFYIMATALLGSTLLAEIADQVLVAKLESFGKLLDEKSPGNPEVSKYRALSSKQTTDAEKRKSRQILFIDIVKGL